MADIRITPASSIMAFTSSLNFTERITQDASGSLNIYGSGSTGRTELFSIDGNNGRLFSVSDDLSDSLFSVNTIAGLPVIEAFADNTVNIGQYGTPIPLKVSGSSVYISDKLFVSRSDNPNTSAIYTTFGTKTEPAYTFIDDSDTGMFRYAANTVALSGGGNIGLMISDSELRLNPGTTSTQANILMADNDTVPLISKVPVASVSVGNATLASTATIALSTNQSVTFNNAGSGDASGTSFNGSAARTISYNTVGAPSTGGAGATGTWGIAISGQAATATSSSMAVLTSITDTTTTNATHYLTFTSTASGNNFLRVDSSTLTYNPSTNVLTVPTVNSTTAVQGGNGSASTPAFSFSGDTNTGMYNISADTLGFSTAGTERMRITSTGLVGIGITPTYRLHVSESSTSTIAGYFQNSNEACYTAYQSSTTTLNSVRVGALGNNFIVTVSSDGGPTERLRITSGGGMGLGITSPTNTAGRFEASNDIVAYSTSDKRWKNNIVKIDSPLEKISQISGVEFDWVEDEPLHGNKGHDVGVIAQEIELVIPEAVQTRESGMKAVQYDKIIPLLIESIKEQQKQIDELKELVNKLTK